MPEPLYNLESVSTHWTAVITAGESDSVQAREALEFLCSTYWPPLLTYAIRSGMEREAAKDVVQGFFHHFLEKGYIRAADRQRGRFRSFLLTSFRHFAANQGNRARAQKRGGGRFLLSWDELREAGSVLDPGSDSLPPDKSYDLQWALTVMQRAVQVLKHEHVTAGKSLQFEALKQFLSSVPAAGDYERLATELGLRAGHVALLVHRIRQQYSDLVRSEVAGTLGNPEDIDDELRYLVSLVAR